MPDSKPPLVILDTNVVFDWLLFKDANCTALGQAIENRLVRWVATDSMLNEARHVLSRGTLDAWRHAHESCIREMEQWAVPVDAISLPLPLTRLICSDPDDQKFIDLAVGLPATWLITRDRALLRLRRGAQKLGVEVLSPVKWQLGHGVF